MSMSKYVSQADYWKARCIAAEERLMTVRSCLEGISGAMDASVLVNAGQIEYWKKAVRQAHEVASAGNGDSAK